MRVDVLGFEAGYGRKGVVAVDKKRCSRCSKEDYILGMDQSEGEYQTVGLCLKCLLDVYFEGVLVYVSREKGSEK